MATWLASQPSDSRRAARVRDLLEILSVTLGHSILSTASHLKATWPNDCTSSPWPPLGSALPPVAEQSPWGRHAAGYQFSHLPSLAIHQCHGTPNRGAGSSCTRASLAPSSCKPKQAQLANHSHGLDILSRAKKSESSPHCANLPRATLPESDPGTCQSTSRFPTGGGEPWGPADVGCNLAGADIDGVSAASEDASVSGSCITSLVNISTPSRLQARWHLTRPFSCDRHSPFT